MNTCRRNFMKCVGLSPIVLNMPGVLGAFDKDLKFPRKFTKSICEMCSSRCLIDVRVDEENKLFTQGNIYSKATQGKICARGGSGVSHLLDPKRLVKPLLRIGEKGEGKFKEISWEEAYKFVALKLNEIKLKYGAKSVAFASKSGPESIFINQFAYAYESPNIFDHGNTCPSAYSVALKSVFGTSSLERDYANAKFILSFGHNIYEGMVISYIRAINKALEKGCKLVSLDPRFSMLSSKANEWIPIKPASDIAFMLAFIHTLIYEELYDKKFIQKYTIGFEKLKESIKDYTPELMAKECDIDAKKIKELARECTSFSPHCIVDYGYRSTFTPEEIEFRRAIVIANTLLGNIETKGGIYFSKNAKIYNKFAKENVAPIFENVLPKIIKPKDLRIDGVDIKDGEFSKIGEKRGIYTKAFNTILTQDPYPISGLFISRSNPVITANNAKEVIAALKKLELFVCIDIYLSDSAMYADVILPESSYLERDEQFLTNAGKYPSYSVRQKVLDPIGDTKASSQIFKELATYMNLNEFFPYKDIEDFRMKQAFKYPEFIYELKNKGVLEYGIELLARDKESIEKFIEKYPNSKEFLDEDGEFKDLLSCQTLSGKIELFDEVLEKACAREVLTCNKIKLKEENEFYFIQGKVAVHTNGHTVNAPWLNALMDNYAVWINQKIANDLNLKKGDSIKITNEVGSVIAQVLPTIGIREDTIFAYFGFGHINKKGISASYLLKNDISPVCGNNVHIIGVSIEKV